MEQATKWLNWILGIGALWVLLLVVVDQVLAPRGRERGASVVDIDEVEARAWRRSEGPVLGNPSGKVTMVVFSDFQCPACRVLAGRLRLLESEYPGELQIIFRHRPLPSHEFALPAAIASDCAHRQGFFRAFHDVLFAQQRDLGWSSWMELAATAGVPDLAEFDQCMRASSPSRWFLEDRAVAEQWDISTTPTVLLGRRRWNGVPPLDSLRSFVTRELALR